MYRVGGRKFYQKCSTMNSFRDNGILKISLQVKMAAKISKLSQRYKKFKENTHPYAACLCATWTEIHFETPEYYDFFQQCLYHTYQYFFRFQKFTKNSNCRILHFLTNSPIELDLGQFPANFQTTSSTGVGGNRLWNFM